MSFLSSLPRDAVLLDVFKRIPALSRPLIEYHEVLMRGPSPFTVAERELIAGYVSGLNACGYCHGVHTATAEQFGIATDLMAQLLEALDKAPLEPRMKPVLSFVRKLTLSPSRVVDSDAEAVFDAGWDETALMHAASVCALFNLMNRMVEGVGLKGSPSYFKVASERLSSHGYAGLLKLLPSE